MAKKTNSQLNPLLLAAIALLLLVGGWLMKSLPIFLLFGYAPLFALTDSLDNKKPFWNQFEYILVVLGVSFFAAHIFYTDQLVISIIQAILMTLPFVAYGFVYQALGKNTIKFTIVFFWLALEYALLKTPWRENWIFLADGMSLYTSWFSFTYHTGYLSIGAWILIGNLFLYEMFWKENTFKVTYAIAFGIWSAAPIALKLLQSWEPISSNQMFDLYGGGTTNNIKYNERGEWMGRTAAWISVLVLILSMVKNQIRKK